VCDVRHIEDGESAPPPARVVDLVDELVVALTNRRIYHADHPRVASSVQSLASTLERLLAASGATQLEIGSAEGTLFDGAEPLLGASLVARRITEPLDALSSGGLWFRRGATARDFVALCDVLGARPGAFRSHVEANEALARDGAAAVRLLSERTVDVGTERERSGPAAPAPPALSSGTGARLLDLDLPLDLYADVVDGLQDLTVKVCRGESFGLEPPRGYVERILEKLREDAKSMFSVTRYEQYDAFTFGHSIRVCVLALHFARTLTRDEDLLQRIGVAALLHDVGKAWVPFEILHAKGRLTPAERREMNKHTVYGGEMLLGVDDADPLSVAVAFGHHRGEDGAGYPRLPARTRQSDVLKIVKICDVYEALTSVRPYKPRMSPLRAYRIMMSMTGHFDGYLLRRFVETVGVFPVGSRVRLHTGETARVAAQTGQLDRPVVDVETVEGDRVRATEGEFRLDLSRIQGRDAPRVVELLLDAEM
jgi:HD-GYP domain-containing protein (c-di-GMP phosphodiesterase class II)